MRPIDADALIKQLKSSSAYNDYEWAMYADGFIEDIENAPSIDIVRCKECKHGEYREDFNDYECHSSGCGLVYDADFYCADGERKESE